MVGGHDEEVADDEGMADDAGGAEVVDGGELGAVEGDDEVAGDLAVGPPFVDVPGMEEVAAAKHGDAGEFAFDDAGDGAAGEEANAVGAGVEVLAAFGVAVGEDAGEAGGDAEVLGVGGGEEFLGAMAASVRVSRSQKRAWRWEPERESGTSGTEMR